jgi:hypothetical protein
MTDKEKHIVEMAKYCCFPCDMECNGECLEGTDPCKCYISLEVAKTLYNASYRKQVDGEWEERIFIIFDTEKVGYHCPKCNTTWDVKTNYCPNCGAKMKGCSE